MDVVKIRSDLKSRIAKGLNFGIEAVEEILNPASAAYNRFILLKSKYNDLMYISSENTLPYDQIEIGLNRLRGTLLTIVDELTEEDFGKAEIDSNLKVTALSNRRINFFSLLEIHYKNINAIVYRESYGEKIDVYYGREALHYCLQSIKFQFKRQFKDKDLNAQENITDFFQYYFEGDRGMFEVYFKTIRHLLQYIMDSEVEKLFFFNTFKAQLSRHELAFIFYYALSGVSPGFKELLKESTILNDLSDSALIIPEHAEHVEI